MTTPSPTLPQSFGRFAVVSAVSFAFIVGTTALLHEVVRLPPEAAYGIALVLVFLLNFSLMRNWAYAHTRADRSARSQFLLAALTSVGFRVSEFLAFAIVHTWLGVYYLAAVVGIMVVSNLSKFAVFHSVVFARRRSR